MLASLKTQGQANTTSEECQPQDPAGLQQAQAPERRERERERVRFDDLFWVPPGERGVFPEGHFSTIWPSLQFLQKPFCLLAQQSVSTLVQSQEYPASQAAPSAADLVCRVAESAACAGNSMAFFA